MLEKILKKLKGEEEESDSVRFEDLKRNLINTKMEISDLNTGINYTTDPILLNQLIFQLKAAEMRYRYWFKIARDFKMDTENHE